MCNLLDNTSHRTLNPKRIDFPSIFRDGVIAEVAMWPFQNIFMINELLSPFYGGSPEIVFYVHNLPSTNPQKMDQK
jgi:hypothetical protein